MTKLINRLLVSAAALCIGALGMVSSVAADIPSETYEALDISKSASPKELYDALKQRYHDPAQGAGKGKFADLWEAIPMSRYFNPGTFYKPPSTVKEVNSREECVECHKDETAGWVQMWKNSPHANLDEIRKLAPNDPRHYKKAKLEEIENNLRSIGKLGRDEPLKEVGCIDCHVDINTAKKADHTKDLRLPDAAVCGTCHLQEFAERESERDTAIWPNDEWPKGRPSHALDYQANVETGIWAGMAEREIAEGCTGCHYNQNKCDGCHTRHEFSVVEARKPEACARCHNGLDHDNNDAYALSKHGTIYQTRGDEWNWEVPLKDAFEKSGQTAPTCASCHMEYKGKYGHNVVRKVRWANYPGAPGIAENIKSDWAEKRKEAWVETCNQCHSERFARAYLEMIDNATLAGVAKYQEAAAVVGKLYDDGLLPGQQTNRPAPPKPDSLDSGPAQFYQLFWAKGNNPSVPERKLIEMGENELALLHVSVAHVNYGGWTYTTGWEPMLGTYTDIMQADTELREKAALMKRVEALEAGKRTTLRNHLNTIEEKVAVGGLGSGMLLTGGLLGLVGWRRRRSANGHDESQEPLE